MEKRYRKAVFIVTYRKEKNKINYLVLKRKLHWTGWEFPKGGIDSKKSMLDEVRRETKEETGQFPFKIKSFNKKGKYLYEKEYPDRKGFIGQSYRLFSAEIKNKKVILDKREHSAYKWLDFENAYKKLTFPNQRICLNIVNNLLMKR
ncbi:MAG: NUDIX domain-containing protein [Candidatus Nanoarchaeia archaeon]|nr:NUDIX domain-containing protein [Candidatus Nanoarchaeia archaeon]